MEPLYQKVKNYITREIASGAWAPGARLPSEHELVRRLGVSRMTVNRALRELSAQGMVQRTAGVGTFVARARLQRPAQVIHDIAEEVRARGQDYRAHVLHFASEPADPVLAELFNRSAGSALFHCLVVHSADALPLLLEDRWVNPAVAPEFSRLDLQRTTATAYLLETAPVQRLEQTVEAIEVDATARRHLALAEREPVLLLRRRTWADDQVASYAQLYFPGSRYRYGEGAESLPKLPARFLRTEHATEAGVFADE